MLDFTSIKTPFYLYDLDLLEETVSLASKESSKYGFFIHYAVKANYNPVIFRNIKKFDLGVDCVSGNEVRKSLEHGFPSNGIVFAGVGKTNEEIVLALENDIFCLNCESLEELEVVAEVAERMKKPARVALRVNPSVDANTHRLITTGMDENKFGISLHHLQNALEYCKSSPNLEFIGLHFHIGSQITSLEPYRNLCNKVNHIWKKFDIQNYGGRLLNMGGGLGIDYNDPEKNRIPDFKSFFALFYNNLRVPPEVKVHFELGRSLVGQCGRLVTKVLYTKQGENKKFVITDAGMTELMRPVLYQAVHRIINISSQYGREIYDVAGPICETSDIFAKDTVLPFTSRGHLLQILSCGAYAESMTLNFNLRQKPDSIYISQGEIFSS